MKSKSKLLFWLNNSFLHFSLSYYLQSKLDADFFGIVDINDKPKKFFKEQKLVNFEKTWFFHDHIKKNHQKHDLDYLSNFENKYKINLWELALNERFFISYNRFYKFEKPEILSILEQELKLFELILNEVKPDYLLTMNPVYHYQKLLLELCRAKGIRVLSACRTGINDQTVLVENGSTFDLNLNQTIDQYYNNEPKKNIKKDIYDSDQKIWIQDRTAKFWDKIIALKDYLSVSDHDLINSNFMYYGRTKFKVIQDALFIEYRRNCNYRFLQKHSTISPNLNVPFVYFPMNINEEASLFHYAPHHTNQIEVIHHIAKSIPSDHVLYVKEHIAAGLRYWNDINYYKEIIDMPNVVLINPNFDNNVLIEKSQLVITIRGTSTLKAAKLGKSSITFGVQPYQIIPSVFKVTSLDTLPELINTAMKFKADPLDYKKFEEFFENRGFNFPLNIYEIIRNKAFFSGSGIFSNVMISNKNMIEFLENNEKLFLDFVNEHLKLLGDRK